MTHASHNASHNATNSTNGRSDERLTADQVITRAGLVGSQHYAHTDTGSVMTGREWAEQIREADRETDSAFDPAGDGAHLVEVESPAASITRIDSI